EGRGARLTARPREGIVGTHPIQPSYVGIPSFFQAPVIEPARVQEGMTVVAGVPIDQGIIVVKPGARFGPRAIREASSIPRAMFAAATERTTVDVDTHVALRLRDEPKIVDIGDFDIDPTDIMKTSRAVVDDAGVYRMFATHRLKMLSARTIRERGAKEVIREAMEAVASDADAVYVTIDIDVVTNSEARGTGAAVFQGIRAEEFLQLMEVLGSYDIIKSIDLCEVSPPLDP